MKNRHGSLADERDMESIVFHPAPKEDELRHRNQMQIFEIIKKIMEIHGPDLSGLSLEERNVVAEKWIREKSKKCNKKGKAKPS